MRIRVENTYENGHTSVHYHDIDEATELPHQALGGDPHALDYLWDTLWEYTGDGTGENMYAIYEVEILDSTNPAWIGLTYEWNG